MNFKTYTLIFVILFGIIGNDIANAGPGRKDKKKRMKKSEMRDAIADYEKEVESLKEEIESLKNDNESLEEDLADANLALAEQEAKAQEAMTKAAPYVSDRMPTEVYFKIQMGAYEELDLRNYFKAGKVLETETVEGELKKYVVGEFDNFESAKKFQNDLRKLGVKDAWLVPYKNQRRISDEEASELVGVDIRE